MKILHVVGARPNFMKAGPVISALKERQGVEQVLVHTGQHYDMNMSDIFFTQLGLPEPDINLNVGSGSHTFQTAQVMLGLEPVLIEQKPDIVLVYGDVNSTMAAALACAKLLVPVGHVEAGLRSFDMTMPEEVNRLLTDHISGMLFTHSEGANENLRAEGIVGDGIVFVGNVMIDTLLRLRPRAEDRWFEMAGELGDSPFVLVTLHRAETVDDPGRLHEMITTLSEVGRRLAVFFPVHPRTRKVMENHGITVEDERLILLEPLGYVDFLALELRATMVITDSGGVQEESTYLGIPCLTAREHTERPVTVDVGTNTLIGYDMDEMRSGVDAILSGAYKSGSIPPLWDGHAAERIADAIC